MSDGSSQCVFNKEELDEHGNPKIKVCDSNFCDSATLQEYAGSTDIARGNQSPSESENPSVDDLPSSGGDSGSSGGGSHSSSNSNNDSDSETDLNPSNPTLGGQDNSGSGTGTVDNNSPANGSGAGDGVGTSTGSGTGTGVGTGSGSGSGSGDGEGEGEGSESAGVDYPSLKDFNLRELMSKTVDKFKSKKLMFRFPAFSGSCQPISISIFLIKVDKSQFIARFSIVILMRFRPYF
ncbi:hypothetical protein IFE17_04455 [Actinobacillus sp. GY-402]|nr:hypothetical protein IFE17_04455 [Actinobacillus sp. GY-402]